MNGTAYGFLRRGTGGRQGPQEKPWENIENHTAYVSDVLPLAGAVQRGAHRSPTKPASLMYSPCDVQRLYCCSRIVLPKGACVFRGDNPFPKGGIQAFAPHSRSLCRRLHLMHPPTKQLESNRWGNRLCPAGLHMTNLHLPCGGAIAQWIDTLHGSSNHNHMALHQTTQPF